MSEPLLLIEDDGPVRWLTFNRPRRLNAFTLESYRRFAEALAAADADEGVSVVGLRGSGRAFSSGVDLSEVAGYDLDELTAAFSVLVLQLGSLSKPLIAGVHGAAVGIGVTMLLHCDLVIVAVSSRLRLPFADLGTVPEAGSSWLLPRVVGLARASELLLTGRWLTAQEAVEYGLALRVCADDDLATEIRAVAQQIGAMRSPALQAAKRLIRHDWSGVADEVLERELDEARGLREKLGRLGR